jgi:hypothetical protein
MSIVSRAAALVFAGLVALPFAACGGTTAGGNGTCSSYCQVTVACADPTTCVLADPSGAQASCVSTCETGMAALTSSEQTLVDTCFACLTEAAGGKCFSNLPKGACDAQCNGAATTAAGNKWDAAVAAAPTPAAALCTNGMNAYGGSSCTGGGTDSSCTNTCCNGSSCTTADVAVECSGANLDMCTCTAGKNKGKTVSATSCSGDLWTLCNL